MIIDWMDCIEKWGYERLIDPHTTPPPNRHVIMSLFALHPPPPCH